MRRLGTAAALAFALLTAHHASARADGLYFTEAFGGTKLDNEISDYTDGDGAFHLHVGAGYRASRISFEVWFGLDDVDSGAYYATSPNPTTYGMDFKYAAPITKRIEVYARASVSRMEIEDGVLRDYAGRGLGVGTGAQIKGKVPIVTMLYPPLMIICAVSKVCADGKLGPRGTVALYVDQGYDFYRLHRDYESFGSIDAEARRWSIGFAFGSDF